MTRKAFRLALAAIETAKAERGKDFDALQAGYDAACMALWHSIRQRGWPLKVADWTKPGAYDARKPLDAEWKQKAKPLYDLHRQAIMALVPEADRIADTIIVRPGDNWHELYRCHTSAYSTQGHGADSYARKSVERRLAEVEALGIETRTTKEDVQKWGCNYVGSVKVRDTLDVEILKRKPGMSIRDYLKWCWSKGANPRVLCPYLPDGLEEKMGVGYQGQDIEPTASEWLSKHSE